MGAAASTYSSTWQSTSQGAKTAEYRLRRYASTTLSESFSHWIRVNTFSPPTTEYDLQSDLGPTTDWRNYDISLACDTTWYYRTHATFATSGDKFGVTKSFKSRAIEPTLDDAPTLDNETSTSVRINNGSTDSFTPATVESETDLYIQYKLTSEPTTWTTWGTALLNDQTGYTDTDCGSTTITGLTSSTSYDFRFYLSRAETSNPTKDYYSATSTTTTAAGTPTVTTNAVSSIGIDGATFNATVDINDADSATLTFQYDTDSGAPYANETAGQAANSDGSYSEGVTGLSASTTYYLRAHLEYTIDDTVADVYGDEVSFSTTADPGQEAADEDHMQTQYVDAIYGDTPVVTFTLRSPAGTSSDVYYTGTAPTVATDTEVWIDGTSDGQLDNAITRQAGTIAGNMIYKTTLSAAQTSGSVIDIIVKDPNTGSEAWRDHHIQVRTIQNLGQVVVDASNKGTNNDAVTYTGNGTGAGLKCVGGDNDGADIEAFVSKHVLNYGTLAAYNSTTSVDLDNSTASSTDDYYNGAVVLFTGGTGAGQARTITDYDGGTYAATLGKALAAAASTDTTYVIVPSEDVWSFAPGSELSSVPTKTSTVAKWLQFLFQRFAYKRTQTATTFTMLKADGSTSLTSGTVNDDGTTQTHEELGSQ